MSTPYNSSDAVDAIPTDEQVASLSQLEVVDQEGAKIRLGSLWESQKTVAVFIRHFWCGKCKLYIQHLIETVHRSYSLSESGVSLVIIGCGDYQPIKGYKSELSCPFPIYGNPSKSAYQALDLQANLAMTAKGHKKASYLTESNFQQIIGSIGSAFSNLKQLGSQGSFDQNGGEFVFGPGNTCWYAHRMRTTEDHAEASELLEAAGVQKKA